MESEKVKEIKKALEDNANYEHYDKLGYIDGYKCKTVAYADILTLINELESENERLLGEKQKILEYMKTGNYAKLKKEDMYWGYQMGIGMLEHEIDRQNDRIAELEKEIEENAFYSKGYAQGIKNTYEVVVPDKLKQFAERLKERILSTPHILGGEGTIIDETLKECLCDNNQ